MGRGRCRRPQRGEPVDRGAGPPTARSPGGHGGLVERAILRCAGRRGAAGLGLGRVAARRERGPGAFGRSLPEELPHGFASPPVEREVRRPAARRFRGARAGLASTAGTRARGVAGAAQGLLGAGGLVRLSPQPRQSRREDDSREEDHAYARATTLQARRGGPPRIRLAYRPSARSLATGEAFLPVDGSSGKGIGVTLWKSEAATQASREGAWLRALSEWAVRGSNTRPPACKAGALPAELTAQCPRRDSNPCYHLERVAT